MATKVSDVLKVKGHQVVTVAPDQTLASVAAILTEHRIGAAPVVNAAGDLVGIISERDLVRGIAERGSDAMSMRNDQLMTRDLATCAPDDLVVRLMEVMTNRRIRHLPVMQGGRLAGIVSIGDVVKQRLAEAQFELDELRRYISS